MKSIPKAQLYADESPNTAFEYCYSEALEHYEMYKKCLLLDAERKKNPHIFSRLENGRDTSPLLLKGKFEGLVYSRAVTTEIFRVSCIKTLKKCVDFGDKLSNPEEVFNAILLLVRLLHNDSSERKEKERFFFLAVERLGLDNLLSDPILGKILIDTYVQEINHEFEGIDLVNRPDYVNLMLGKIIRFEYDKKNQEGLFVSHAVAQFIENRPLKTKIVSKIMEVGGFRSFAIISDDCDEIIESEGFENVDSNSLRQCQCVKRLVKLNVLDRPRQYTVYMVILKTAISSDFKEFEWNYNLLPLIEYLIFRQEYSCQNQIFDFDRQLELPQRCRRMLRNTYEYDGFITRVLERFGSNPYSPAGEIDTNSIDNYLKAIEICKILVCRAGSNTISDTTLQNIDSVLGGKIHRKVLQMVNVMMLTQNESMNGFGYPFSLSKSSIPLSGRMFSIIRRYEGLGSMTLDASQLKQLNGTSRNNFIHEGIDSSIYRVFIDCLQDGSIRKIPTKPRSATKVTKYRKKIYREYVAQFKKLYQIKSEIGEKLHRARYELATTDDKNTLLKEANELKTFLLKEADMRKVIIITRHGETESDVISGKPGLDTEELTENGENSSSKKGEILGGLDLKVFSSPLVRALQTSDIICKKVKDHVAELITMDSSEYQKFISYSGVKKEPSLANPVKSIENDRYDSLLQKFNTDNNTKEIREFLMNMLYGMEETMNVCITHRDTARHMIMWLNNMFSKNSISGSKVTVGNDTIYEIFLRGGSIVKAFSPSTLGGGVEDGTFQIDTSSLKKDSGDGYIFSIANWQSLLKSLNTISEEVFSRPFFSNESELINLIDLTDELLDFIDFESENNPEKFALFVKAVALNSELQEVVSTYLQNRSNFVK